ncbi:hypothetical protein [Saccharopolyspora pogona]|uniref:hypothetical protein n=1 Tax=Saccharopolyspora pogona TaxID=333966 RepID=UPI0016891A79|nr:hypothetical protein [Saccharopolyspora pogona]
MFERTFQQRPRCGGVAQAGLLVEPEHDREVQRVGAVGKGFLKLPIDAEAFEGGFVASEGSFQPEGADRSGFQGGPLVDEQVRVGGVRPA